MKSPLKVLQDSVVRHLEGGIKSSKVPCFHEYLEGPGDLESEKIPLLKEELHQISKAFIEGMPLTQKTVEVVVPVHETGYSPLLGAIVEKDARKTAAHLLNEAIEQCELAILAFCGFGKHSAIPEKLKEAIEQLCENMVIVNLSLPKGSMELKLLVYDSNNNPKHGFLTDGLWEPFKAIGIARWEVEEVTFGFQATMDYKNGEWKLNHFGSDFLNKLAKESSLFRRAYRKIAGKDFEEKVIEVNPELIESIKSSPHFQQTLNRICSRWTR